LAVFEWSCLGWQLFQGNMPGWFSASFWRSPISKNNKKS
jgi:hypothetical protein